MKYLKTAIITVLIILCIAIITTLLIGGYMPLFSISFGVLFIYYVILYIILIKIIKKENPLYKYIIGLLFILPILWGIFDFEGLFNFL